VTAWQLVSHLNAHLNHTEAKLHAMEANARHAKMDYHELEAEEKRVHKKWLEFNKKQIYYSALKLEDAEQISHLQSIMMRNAGVVQKWEAKETAERKVMQLYVDKFNATDAAQRAYSHAFKARGCGLLPHQKAELKARNDAMAILLRSAKDATSVANEKFDHLQSLEEDGAGTEASSEPGAEDIALPAELASEPAAKDAAEDAPAVTSSEPAAEDVPAPAEAVELVELAEHDILDQSPDAELEMEVSTEVQAKEKEEVKGPNSPAPAPEELVAPPEPEPSPLDSTAVPVEEHEECAYDRQMGEMNFNAAEEARKIMMKHQEKVAYYRGEKEHAFNAVSAEREELEGLEAKAEAFEARQHLASKLEMMPCGVLSAEDDWDNKESQLPAELP